ncbi:MAG: aspartate-semialdehyde dehydrogenase [Flavobacteriaceae bacterium]|nr:aspartate-semialdehyde dehydrogenase [Flavobacteriaceae bacterium]
MKLAIVGATGLVGKVVLQLLEERRFPVTKLIPVASKKSAGKKVLFRNSEIEVTDLDVALAMRPKIAIFSAGGEVSKKWAPVFSRCGCFVIDNSSAWRMNPEKKLIVPEINTSILNKQDRLIANPNCSTIQLVLVLAPLHQVYKMKRVVVSTYQSVSGTGSKAVEQLENEILGKKCDMVYPYQIFKNALPHCDVFLENGYTKEEIKLSKEPQKILQDNSFSVTATAVRIPTAGGHSESVNIEFEKDFNLIDVKEILKKAPGVTLKDEPSTNTYPMPIDAAGKDDVFVGRIRRDESKPKCINLWIVADNLRKGAATNAVQIAEYVLKKFL